MGANVRKNVLRRQARLRRQGKAVSPVVATLILILVAVAAAAALYLWLVAWQGNITGGIGQPSAQYTVTIGGSTSVYPFTQQAATQFQANNSNIVISVNQGGTGAGMLAVCHGAVDIGEASSLQTVSGLQTSDGCPATTVLNVVAYDAVDPIVSSAAGSPATVPVAGNTGPLTGISSCWLLAIYGAVSTTAPSTTVPATCGGVATGLTAQGGANWNQIPTNPATCTAAPVGSATCPGVNLNHAINAYERSDTSGTEQTFTAKLLDIHGNQQVTTYAAVQSEFTGCSSDGQLASCGIAVTGENGNPAVITSVKGDIYGIGFASDGLARATGSGVQILNFEAVGQTSAVTPTLGSSGTIANAIQNTGNPLSTQYAGWRPFTMVTTNSPTGEVERFIQWVLDPANNINIATETAEISVYSV